MKNKLLLLAAQMLSEGLAIAATVVGFTPGNFKVSETGATTYSIPIQASPGTAGMEPKLSLNYNSDSRILRCSCQIV